jgi:hypothetical protein
MLRRGLGWLIVLTVFQFWTTHKASAQIQQPYRFEEEHKFTDRDFNIISLQKEGLMLIRDREKFEEGKKLFDIIHLDSMLNRIWSEKLRLEGRLNFVGYEYLPDQLFLLFRNGETNTNDFTLFHFSLTTHQYEKYEIKHQFEFKLTHFSVVGSTAIFGGYTMREPTVLLYSVQDKQIKVVPGFLLSDTELLDIRVNHNSTFNVLMAERGNKENKKILMRTYDETGALLLEDAIPMEKDKTPLSGITSSLIKDELIIIGTYTIGNSKQAVGFFSSMIDPFSEQPVYYTDFAQLQHALDYLGAKRSSKVKQKSQSQRESGKTPSFRSNASLVRIHESAKGFFLLSELYQSNASSNYPPYWNNYPYSYGGMGYGYSPYGMNPRYNNRYYNTPYSQNAQNSEVRMLESVIIFFGNDAKVDWDASFEFKNVKYTTLEQTSDFVETNKGVLIAYKKDNEILTKMSVPYDDYSVSDTTKIKLPNELDVLRENSNHDGGFRHWYADYLYVWGYQSIKDKSKVIAEDPNRYVFYINKVSAK